MLRSLYSSEDTLSIFPHLSAILARKPLDLVYLGGHAWHILLPLSLSQPVIADGDFYFRIDRQTGFIVFLILFFSVFRFGFEPVSSYFCAHHKSTAEQPSIAPADLHFTFFRGHARNILSPLTSSHLVNADGENIFQDRSRDCLFVPLFVSDFFGVRLERASSFLCAHHGETNLGAIATLSTCSVR